MVEVIDGIQLESRGVGTTDNRACRGVDIRVYRWLQQWLTWREAEDLIYSLAWPQLIRLVIMKREEIRDVRIW